MRTKGRYITTRVVPDKRVEKRYRLCAGWIVFDTQTPTARHQYCVTRLEADSACERLNTAELGPMDWDSYYAGDSK